VFFKGGVLARLEELLANVLVDSTVLLQARCRRARATPFERCRRTAAQLQAHMRRRQARVLTYADVCWRKCVCLKLEEVNASHTAGVCWRKCVCEAFTSSSCKHADGCCRRSAPQLRRRQTRAS
jgi:hypothetical protein